MTYKREGSARMAGSAVVVTGLGAMTPLGGDAASTWAALLAGESGVRARLQPRSSITRCR